MRLASLLKQRPSLNTLVRVGIGLVVVLTFFMAVGMTPMRPVEALEKAAYDARLRLFMPRTVDPRIVILDIDERSLNAEGHWPWSRDKLALMVRQLFDKYNIAVMGFDIAFPERDNSSGIDTLDRLAHGDLKDDTRFQTLMDTERGKLDFDKAFADEIAKHPVVLGFFINSRTERSGVLPPPDFRDQDIKTTGKLVITEATGYSGNRPELQKAASGAGHLSPVVDFDGLLRRVAVLAHFENGYYETMSVAVTRLYLGNVPLKVRTDKYLGNDIRVVSLRVGDKDIPVDDAVSALIPFRGGSGSFRYVSATDVIRGTLGANELVGKIVLVGTSAQGLLDVRATPVGEDYNGVEIHANMISGILDQTIKQRPFEGSVISAFMTLVAGIALAIFLPRLGVLPATAVTVAALGVFIGINIYAWVGLNYVLDIAGPLVMILTLYFFNMVYGFFLEARSRRLITGLFGTYVPKELVAEMALNPGEYSMRGESRDMTVLFSDVRDFTSISEGLSAEGLKDLMNAYLTAMTEVIQEKRGTIDKYIGDAIMAFWGAPLNDAEHAAHALEAALAMQKRIRGLDAEFVRRGWPVLNIGVGLNCGEMNVGDMGSRFRRAYTVMGDAVNIASRLEGLTKEYGVGILVSEGMVTAAQGFVYREVDRVVVKGRTEGIAIYEPIGKIGEVPEATLSDLDKFHKALEWYRKQRWNEAEEGMKALRFANPESKLYKLYLKRIADYRASAPQAEWNGVWVWTTK